MKIFTLILSIALLSSIINNEAVHATTYGGKFIRSGVFTLYSSYGGAHRYYGNVWQGAANWSATPTNLNISPTTSPPYAINIDIYDTYNSATWWGITYWNPCPGSGCNYVRNYFYLNQRTLDPESDFTRTKVTTHEYGHAIGLDHAPGGKVSIMNQGYLSYNTPQTYDINDINWLY